MIDSDHQNINELLKKIQVLLDKQNTFYQEIFHLKQEVEQLKKTKETLVNPKTEPQDSTSQPEHPTSKTSKPVTPTYKTAQKKSMWERLEIGDNLEKFIGENLMNKIGILITIIGVGIGAKYVINHELISPLTRIILGYLLGLGLIGFAYKLKKNYHNFSAVLLSGGMAILYFITYFAYDYYQIIPQSVAFILMLLFTIFTVLAALHYKRQVIALIGLVGAYATPFLLSNNSGNIFFLFSYILLINIGILIISFKKNWKPLYYISFVFTWLIFFKWYDSQYKTETHFYFTLIFLLLFFVVFYGTFLSYKLLKKEKFNTIDISILLANSFIFFGLGYDIIEHNSQTENLLGLFALLNALIHFIVSYRIYKEGLGNKSLFYFVSGLVLVFITIAIPIQLDGNWVTLLWIGEAVLIFWIGRSKQIPVYEKLTYPLLFLGFFSLIHDWNSSYHGTYYSGLRLTPVFNIQLVSSLLFTTALIGLNYLKSHYKSAIVQWRKFYKIISYAIPVLLVIVLYYSFRLEIANYWNQLYYNSKISLDNETYGYTINNDLLKFKEIWIANYSMLFLAVFAYLGTKTMTVKKYIIFILSGLAIFIYLTESLMALSELRDSYLSQSLPAYYDTGSYHLWIRYISYFFVALLIGTV